MCHFMRGRFAPSPTGRLHLGNARSALLGWLAAKAPGGSFLLRVEDLDRARCKPEYVDGLFRDLEYLGLTWDETPLYQSQRGEAYEAALRKLEAQGRIYRCFCSRTEIARAASAPHGLGDEGPRYPGTCAALSEAQAEARARSRSFALRFRPRAGWVTFDDLIHGRSTQDVDAVVGDFVVQRNDGVASYQLAVVVDDAASRITHVVRGDDLLSSTPRQMQLLEALRENVPQYAHVPLLMGEDGKRLAKRTGAFAVTELREAGVPAERVVGLLAGWCGLSQGAPVRAAELLATFSWSLVSRAPVTVSEELIRSRLGL